MMRARLNKISGEIVKGSVETPIKTKRLSGIRPLIESAVAL